MKNKVTFPFIEPCRGEIKLNGEKIGWFILNCELKWHAKFTINGTTLDVWKWNFGDMKTYTKIAISKQILIETSTTK